MLSHEELLRENERLRALLQQRDEEIRLNQEELQRREVRIAELETRLNWLNGRLFGSGKSETLDRAQLLLELGDVESELKELRGQEVKITVERRLPRPRVIVSKEEHFKDLPVEETVVIEPEEVQKDPDLYERIGEERMFEVDIVPPRLFKREIIRPKYRLILDRQMPPVVAGAPVGPVQGGYASAGLLAWVAISKYVDHQPLYRLEKMSHRWGARLSRQVMSDWIEVSALWLKIIYDRMRKDLLEGPYIQADETPVQYLDPDARKGNAQRGFLWVIGRPDGPVIFDWRLNRQHSHAKHLLRGFKGVLQSDGYQAYDACAGANKQITQIGCMAHVRRKWFDALKTHPREAAVALRIFARIYQREQQYKEEGIDHQTRATRRQQQLSILFRRIHALALIVRKQALPKSKLGQAASYTLSQWKNITPILDHGIVQIDNNLIENAIRPTAIGKKNWLFVGAPQAGGKSAIIYSIVVTCQRFRIDPLLYIKDVLSKLPNMTNQQDITHLIPQYWKPNQNP